MLLNKRVRKINGKSIPSWAIDTLVLLYCLYPSRFFDSDIWIHDTEMAVRAKGYDVPKYLYPSSCDISVQGFRQW